MKWGGLFRRRTRLCLNFLMRTSANHSLNTSFQDRIEQHHLIQNKVMQSSRKECSSKFVVVWKHAAAQRLTLWPDCGKLYPRFSPAQLAQHMPQDWSWLYSNKINFFLQQRTQLYTTFTNFSMKNLVKCKVYTDVGDIK